ncbi:MAG: hypothetical protein ABIJ57_04420 [Pseudomonadota bacterium]|nr:hypothetical protein [Acidobacteriota bacterium]MBU4329092.1 hypothetical protein [Acidobacteriota bacterium]MBU4495712.1 hypothetical protein [Acidobacteriota bacterium]MCG2815480.1 hypothetical protein [Candidatus Aminicenantes bacterium]
MKLSSPKKIVWFLSILFAVVGIIGFFITIPFVTTYAFYFVAVGWLLLFLGTALKGF